MFHRIRVLRPIEDPFCADYEIVHYHDSYCRPKCSPVRPNPLLFNRHIRHIGFGFHTCVIKERQGQPTLYWDADHFEKLFMRNLEKVGAKNLELTSLADVLLDKYDYDLDSEYEDGISMPLDSLGQCFRKVTLQLKCLDVWCFWGKERLYLGSLDGAIEAARNCAKRMVGDEMDVVEDGRVLDATEDERMLIMTFKRDVEE